MHTMRKHEIHISSFLTTVRNVTHVSRAGCVGYACVSRKADEEVTLVEGVR